MESFQKLLDLLADIAERFGYNLPEKLPAAIVSIVASLYQMWDIFNANPDEDLAVIGAVKPEPVAIEMSFSEAESGIISQMANEKGFDPSLILFVWSIVKRFLRSK